MFGGFSSSKLKPQLKMAVSRFQIASNKKTALLKQNMRAVAVLLAEDPPKEEKARIKAEALIRDDDLIEAYDILSLECELLAERIKLIEFSKTCPPDLVSCISTLMYAAPRVDVPELSVIRKQFRAKYGKKFDEAALANEGGILNERVVTKLSVHPPAAYLVQTYLEKICEQFEVDWSPKIKLSVDQMCEPMAPPVGYSVHAAQGTGLGPAAATGLPPRNSVQMPRGSVFPSDDATALTMDSKNNGYNGGGDGGDGGGGGTVIATATAIPDHSHRGGGGASVASSAHFEEPDIYIPSAPGAPTTSSQTGVTPSAPPSMSPNNDNSSYRDLAARFDSLKAK